MLEYVVYLLGCFRKVVFSIKVVCFNLELSGNADIDRFRLDTFTSHGFELGLVWGGVCHFIYWPEFFFYVGLVL